MQACPHPIRSHNVTKLCFACQRKRLRESRSKFCLMVDCPNLAYKYTSGYCRKHGQIVGARRRLLLTLEDWKTLQDTYGMVTFLIWWDRMCPKLSRQSARTNWNRTRYRLKREGVVIHKSNRKEFRIEGPIPSSLPVTRRVHQGIL